MKHLNTGGDFRIVGNAGVRYIYVIVSIVKSFACDFSVPYLKLFSPYAYCLTDLLECLVKSDGIELTIYVAWVHHNKKSYKVSH